MSKLPKIILNASTAKIAGGLIVAHDLAYHLSITNQFNLYLISPDIPKYRNLPENINKIYVPAVLLRPSCRLIMDYIWLPRKIKMINARLTISLGNIPVPVRTNQVILSDNSFISEKNITQFNFAILTLLKHKVRQYLFWIRLDYLNMIIVQTQTELTKFVGFKRNLPTIRVIPPLLPTHIKFNQKGIDLDKKKPGSNIRLICASHFFAHKNLDILIEMIQIAKNKDIHIQVIFTLNEKRKQGGSCFITKIKHLIDEGHIINAGDQPPNKIMHLINQCDGLILPSLAETFGLNCLEAWSAKVPLFISDLPFAREVCGNAARFFNPKDPESILTCILETFADKKNIEILIENGLERLKICSNINDYIKVINEYVN